MATAIPNTNSVKVLMLGNVTPSDLRRHLSQFGQLSSLKHPYFKPANTSYSYGTIVTFTTNEAASSACNERHQYVEGFRIQISKNTSLLPLESQPDVFGSSGSNIVYGTVKVSMFNGQLGEDHLRSLFCPYGALLSQPRVISGTPPYSYIEFGDPEAAKKSCQAIHKQRYNGIDIKARLCESRKIVPQKPVDVCANPASWNWSSSSQNVKLVNVVSPGTEWTEVSSLFYATMPQTTCRLVSVDRIMNKMIYDEYKHRKQTMEKRGKCLNEKLLFHGSRQTDPKKIYESDVGIDLRYSNEGRLGRGAYFAENSSYSNDYSFKINGNSCHRQIFLAAVLTGETCVKDRDSSLVEAPCKPGSTERYDSVSAHFGGSDIFVVYKLDMAYPTHLITYTTF